MVKRILAALRELRGEPRRIEHKHNVTLEIRPAKHTHTRRCDEDCQGTNMREIEKAMYDVIENTLSRG